MSESWSLSNRSEAICGSGRSRDSALFLWARPRKPQPALLFAATTLFFGIEDPAHGFTHVDLPGVLAGRIPETRGAHAAAGGIPLGLGRDFSPDRLKSRTPVFPVLLAQVDPAHMAVTVDSLGRKVDAGALVGGRDLHLPAAQKPASQTLVCAYPVMDHDFSRRVPAHLRDCGQHAVQCRNALVSGHIRLQHAIQSRHSD